MIEEAVQHSADTRIQWFGDAVAIAYQGLDDDSFLSGGRRITVERYLSASGVRPAVILLHGAEGMTRFSAQYRSFCAQLAARGYHAFLVHYFERTGHDEALGGEIIRNFTAWTQTIRDAIAWVGNQEEVDPDSVGALGFSLGAFLALTAARNDSSLKAVVDFFGGLPDQGMRGVVNMPPTLIFHGDADAVVPVAYAARLANLLTERKIPHEVHIYGGEGHGFAEAAASDSRERTIHFLDRHLKRRDA